MSDFCTIEDVQNLLQIEITEAAEVASCQRAIKEAKAAIQNYCRQLIELVAEDVVTLDCAGGGRLFLPELPALAVDAVTENDETLTAGRDYKLGQYGILHRIGRPWAEGIQHIQVVYSHGYDPIPDDVVAIATRAAARMFQAGLRSVESDGLMGVSQKQLGDFSVGFSSEQGGGADQGPMGVSASRMLLLSEKDMLNRYRYTGA